jgi:UDP-N-acetylglucosamine 1-carboxyvinyltransferase
MIEQVNIKQIVAANIRFKRKQLGLTQANAANQMKVTQQTWQQYESGNQDLRIETLQEIAKTLNVDVLDLISATDPKARAEPQAKKKKAA